jgi:hypothetical protein
MKLQTCTLNNNNKEQEIKINETKQILLLELNQKYKRLPTGAMIG